MSYILEALKKFEQKREQKDLSKSMSFLGGPGPEAPKRPLWPYLLVAALILNAGTMLWWMAPWRSQKKETPVKSAGLQTAKEPGAKVLEQNPIKKARITKDADLPIERLIPPKPRTEKLLPTGPRTISGKTKELDRINGVIPFSESEPGKPALASPNPTPAKSVSKKGEASVEKKVIYFKDGRKELCDEVRFTEHFIHCTNSDGGAVINRNMLDWEKTLEGRGP